MSYLDTHFIKTSVINAAGKERLKIRELVNTKFQGDTLKAGEEKIAKIYRRLYAPSRPL